ncbi:MAG: (d)CMP kinase, partial [Myxococcota bacterium]
MTRLIVAIDGPSGAGKGTVARTISKTLGYRHIDTGAMYRAVAWKALQEGIPLGDEARVAELARRAAIVVEGGAVRIDGHDVTSAIRTPEIDKASSAVARLPGVREVLVARQRELGKGGGVVMEGRDIGTVVWPDARLKVFLDARPDVRAARRSAEQGSAHAVGPEVHERDRRDASRPVGTMQPASDAVLLDTTSLDAEETAQRILGLLQPGRRDLLYTFVRGVLALILRVVVRLDVRGRENIPDRGPVILAPNHRSLIDIPVAGVVTKRHVAFM